MGISPHTKTDYIWTAIIDGLTSLSFQSAMTAKTFCVNTVVAKILKDYVQCPTFEELRAEIQQQRYANLRYHVLMKTPFAETRPHVNHWYAVLYVTNDSVIIQDVLLKCAATRFAVHVVKLEDWNTVFMEWIDEDHNRFDDCHRSFVEGMREYQ